MKTCERCDGDVSDTYHRVNAASDGELWSCPNCTADGTVLTGPDDEPRTDRFTDVVESV